MANPAPARRRAEGFGRIVSMLRRGHGRRGVHWRPRVMIPQVRQDIVRRLGGLCELSPGVRAGQLVARLGFLAEDAFGRGLWDLDDERLLEVIRRHEAELASRQSNVA